MIAESEVSDFGIKSGDPSVNSGQAFALRNENLLQVRARSGSLFRESIQADSAVTRRNGFRPPVLDDERKIEQQETGDAH